MKLVRALWCLLIASSLALDASALRVAGRAACAPAPRAATAMREFSTKVKITAETRAPLRQARIFFVYPSTIAGASIASYVALTRIIAGVGGFRTDTNPLADAGNLFVDVAVVAGAVWALRKDLKGRAELLEEVALELEGEPSARGERDEK